jgi:hypothetical protein
MTNNGDSMLFVLLSMSRLGDDGSEDRESAKNVKMLILGSYSCGDEDAPQ